MHFDVVIVGGGTAGCILASRLTEDPSRTVCLIEAGHDYASVEELPPAVKSHFFFQDILTLPGRNPNDPELTGAPDWGFKARLTNYQHAAVLPRGKVIGGSSSVNGGVFFHPLREDLDEWAAAGNSFWAFQECVPYLKMIENDYDFGSADYHGSAGFIPVQRATAADWVPLNSAFYQASLDAGFPDCPDLNMPDSWGVGPTPVNMRDHIRYGSAIGYLIPVRERTNLTILGDSLALRIKVMGGAARSVEVERSGELITVQGDEIILSAGVIGSAQLLLLSGIGPAAELEQVGVRPVANLAGVGRNVRDHPVVCGSWAAPHVVLPTSGPGSPGQVGIRATTPGSDDTMDLRIMSFRRDGEDRFSLPFSLMRAKAAGSIKLRTSDPSIAPCIDLAHLGHPSDMERMRTMLDVVCDLVSRSAYDGVRFEQIGPSAEDLASVEKTERWMLRTVMTGHHASSSCKMGPAGDPMAVVDEFGHVHGMERLRVVDASIMVDCPRVNINCTTMMMAEKLAPLIATQ